MAKKEKKPFVVGDYRGWMAPAWATRAVSLAANVTLLMQITYFCTNALGLDAGITGILLLASKLFDGFTDLVAGVIVDKTKTKWGKARPYEFSILGVWICTILLFSAPNMGIVGKYIWMFVFYTLINSVFATLLNATDAVYLGRAVKEDTDRAKLMSINGIFVTLVCTVISIVLPILIATFGQQEGGWTIISAVLGVPLAIIGMGRFLFIKEMDMETAASAQKISLKVIWEALKSNKYIAIIALIGVLSNLATNVVSGVNTYYFQYIYGDISAAATLGMISLVTPFLLLVVPALMKKFSLTQISMVGFACCVVGNLIKLINLQSMPVLLVGTLLSGVGVLPISLLVNIFLIECMDYGEWKNGVRVEAAYGAINGLGSKVGSAFASAAIGIVMQFGGFDASVAVQSSSANASIIALFAVIPAILFAVAILLFTRYDLPKKLPEIRQELDARRTKV